MSYLSFVGNFFGDRPEQNVEASEWEDLKNNIAIAVKNGTMTKSEGQEAMAKFKVSIGELAKKFVEKVESAIKLTPSDKGNSKTHEVNPIEVGVPKKTQKVREERSIDD